MGRKFERCIKSVKQTQEKRYGFQKYNPYAVCTKSVGRLNAKRKFTRTKPTIKIRNTKFGLEIIKTVYDEFGNVVKKQVEAITK